MKNKFDSILFVEKFCVGKWVPNQSNEGSIGFHWCYAIEWPAEKAGKMGEQLIKVRSQDTQKRLKLHHSHPKVLSEPVRYSVNSIMTPAVISIRAMGVPKTFSFLRACL